MDYQFLGGMLSFVYSKAALLFYLFVLVTEFATKYGIQENAIRGKSYILSLADICGICSLIFIIYFSVNTVWWAFIFLMIGYVIIYKFFNSLILLLLCDKKYLYVISKNSRYFLIPLFILMFVFVKR